MVTNPYYYSTHFDLKSSTSDNIDTNNTSGGKQRCSNLLPLWIWKRSDCQELHKPQFDNGQAKGDPYRVLCTVLVTIVWAGPPSLIEFHWIEIVNSGSNVSNCDFQCQVWHQDFQQNLVFLSIHTLVLFRQTDQQNWLCLTACDMKTDEIATQRMIVLLSSITNCPIHIYRLQTTLREGNVFTPVCDSVHREWGGGHVWRRGVHGISCVQERRPLKRAVRILLECILVWLCCLENVALFISSETDMKLEHFSLKSTFRNPRRIDLDALAQVRLQLEFGGTSH